MRTAARLRAIFRLIPLFALPLALAAAAFAQTPKPVELAAGNLGLSVLPGAKITLSAHGVPVITASSLYLVSPGWTQVYLNQDSLNAAIRTSEEGDAKVATVDYETDGAYARYRYELRPDNTFRMAVHYGRKGGGEAQAQYHTYLNANVFSGAAYKADTVDGPRFGRIPIVPKEGSQEARKFMPDLKSAVFQSRLGEISVSVESDTPATSALTFFEARTETQSWARTRPILWLGAGIPSKPVGADGTRVTVTWRFGQPPVRTQPEAAPAAVKVADMPSAYRPATVEWPVIPRPKDMQTHGAPARLGPKSRIVLTGITGAVEERAAEDLRRDLLEFWGLDIPVARDAGETDAENAAIRIGSLGAAVAERLEGRVPAGAEGYLLDVKKDRVLVAGRDGLGARNGAQTLKQLIRRDEKGLYVRPVTVRDWPSLAFRGVHWLGGPQSAPFHERMIRRILAPLKMNAMVYQVDYMAWDSQKEIFRPERGMAQEEVRKTVALARAHDIEPVPLLSLLGHADWLFHNGQNLDLAMDKGRPYAYNPDAERTYDVIFPMLQETVEVFQPRYFHIGHDEVTMTGRFPLPDYPKSATQLFIEDTFRLHTWLADRGIATMMWGDQMLHASDGGTSGYAETAEDAKARREALPKDIIITDWHYRNADPSYPSVGIFRNLGYPVVGAGWSDPAAIRDFTGVLNRNAAAGYLQTTWAGFAMSEDLVNGPDFAQFVAYLLGAEYAWNGGGPAPAALGYSPEQAFLHFWNRSPVIPRALDGFTVDLSRPGNEKTARWLNPGKLPQTSGAGPRRALLDGYAFQVGGDAVRLTGGLNPKGAWPASVRMDVKRHADALMFLWGTDFAIPAGSLVATLKITYTDGDSVERSLRYARDIFAFTDERIARDAPIAWRGTNPDGETVALRRWEWVNPRPQKTVESVEITAADTEAAPVLLALTGLG